MKKAILVVSFGTSYPDTRGRTIGAVEREIAEKYPEYDVRRAFTSEMVRRIVRKKEGIEIDNVISALTKLKEEGMDEVYIQPLHLLPGIEYKKVTSLAVHAGIKFSTLKIGEPLMYHTEDYLAIVDCFSKIYDSTSHTVLMGHGTHHFSNSCYLALDHFIKQKKLPITLGTVEGYPTIEEVISSLKEQQIKAVHLTPFMMVAGDHARNDMASEEEDSWKSRLEAENIKVDVILKGIGEYDCFRSLFLEKVGRLIGVEK